MNLKREFWGRYWKYKKRTTAAKAYARCVAELKFDPNNLPLPVKNMPIDFKTCSEVMQHATLGIKRNKQPYIPLTAEYRPTVESGPEDKIREILISARNKNRAIARGELVENTPIEQPFKAVKQPFIPLTAENREAAKLFGFKNRDILREERLRNKALGATGQGQTAH